MNGQRGLTLIELVLFIVVISVGLVGVLSVFDVTVKSSADPMLRKQALAIAESLLEEILAKTYQNDAADPTNTSTTLGCTPYTTSPLLTCSQNSISQRANYNDVDDYNGFATTGIYQTDGTAVTGLGAYSLSVAVTPVVLSGVTFKQVTVSVTSVGASVTLSGYRAYYYD